MNTRHIRFIFFVFVLIALVAGLVPMATAAEPPSITVAPVWPATSLTSLDEHGDPFPTWTPDDDYRYVSAELYVTTTVEFWAMDMACTVDSRYLTNYVWDNTDPHTTPAWGDDQRPIWWNDSVWRGSNGDYVIYEPDPTFNALANTMTVRATVSREGNSANAIGRNGQTTTLHLATLTFLVTETAGQSPLNCSFTFLDRDGNAVLRRSGYTAPPPLTTTEGFIVEGHATHQVHGRVNGITVTCEVYTEGGPVLQTPTTTDRNGYYKLPPIREEGHLGCRYEGNVAVPNADLYITSNVDVSMSDRHSYYFLPVELRSGNLDNVSLCGGWQCIDDWDIQKITANWELNSDGDANGDGLTNKADLAIVAGNYGMGEYGSGVWYVVHTLYGVARSFTDTAMDNRVWAGDQDSGDVSQLVPPGRGTRDFWATMSPDGRTVAFVRASTPRGATYPNYELYKLDVPSGRVSQLLSKAQAGNMDAFAPSWSPDGSQIAFNCTSSRGIDDPSSPGDMIPYSGYAVNGAGICLVDANGRNFRQIVGQGDAKIFPPAWIDDWNIVFGGTPDNYVCEDTLCVHHLSWSDPLEKFDDDVDASGRVEDMPASKHSRLFYRSMDESNGESELRFVDSLDYDCSTGCDYVTAAFVDRTTQAGNAYRPNPVHTNVTYCTDGDGDCHDGSYSFSSVDANSNPGITGDIDFYDIRYSSVMLYGEGNDNFWHADYNGNMDDDVSGPCAPGHKCWPEWWSPWNSHVDSYVGAPYWSGDVVEPTDLHAERPTFDMPQ